MLKNKIMKKLIKITLITIIFSFVFISGINNVLATNLTITETTDTPIYIYHKGGTNPACIGNVIQTFKATDTDLNSIDVYYNTIGSIDSGITVRLMGEWDTETEARANCDYNNLDHFYKYYRYTNTPPTSKTLITIPFVSNYSTSTLTIGKYYCATFYVSGGYDSDAMFYGSTNNDYSEGMATTTSICESTSMTNEEQINGVLDIGLILDGQASMNSDEISITYPNATTTTGYFDYEITFDTATSTNATSSDSYVIYTYGTLGGESLLNNYYLENTEKSNGNEIVHRFQSPVNIEKNTTYGEGTLYSKAELYYQPDRFNNPSNIELVATSDLATTTIANNEIPNISEDNPTDEATTIFTTTSSMFFVDCSEVGTGGFFSSSTIDKIGCYAQKSLFSVVGLIVLPPEFTQTYLNNSLNSMKETPPFSLVFDTFNEFNTVIDNTSHLETSEVSLKVGSSSTHTANIKIFDENTLSNQYGTGFKETLFDAIKMVIWIGAGWFILSLITI